MLIFLSVQTLVCGGMQYIKLVCSGINVEKVTKATRCYSNTSVESPRTIIRKVLHLNESEVDTKEIKLWQVVRKTSVKFIPAGINEKFPKLSILVLRDVGLTHLEREDMRQFGEQLTRIEFEMNSLTALEGDLFEYNPNIVDIFLQHNPLKFISPILFENFKGMKKLDYVDLSCECLKNQHTISSDTGGKNNEKCNDEKEREKNSVRIDKRKSFFKNLFEGYQDTKHHMKLLESENYQMKADLKITRLKLAKLEKIYEFLV